MNWWACLAHLCSSPKWQAGGLHFLAHLDWDRAEACGEMISYHWTELTEGIDEKNNIEEMKCLCLQGNLTMSMIFVKPMLPEWAKILRIQLTDSCGWLWPISGIKIAFYKHEWNMSYKWSQRCWQIDRPLCSVQYLFRIIFACLNLWLHKSIHIIPYQ